MNDWTTAELHQCVQGLGHLEGAEVGSRCERERLSRMAVDHPHDPERTSVEQAIGLEVHGPDPVRSTDGRPPLPVALGPFPLGQLGPDRQSLVAIDPVGALVVHLSAFPSQ